VGEVKDTCYLVLSEYGIERMTKRPGTLKRGEVAVRISVAVADGCFEQPAVSAHIDIPQSAVIHPKVAVEVETPPEDDPA
jgi:hypothetical protein